MDRRRIDWGKIFAQLAVYYGDRIPEFLVLHELRIYTEFEILPFKSSFFS